MKAWYYLCIFFFFYSLNTLIEESYDVVYRLEDRMEGNRTEEYMACSNLKKYFSTNRMEIDLNQLNQDVYNYLNNKFGKIKQQVKAKLFQIFNESILVPIREKECFVFRGMFCIPVENVSKLSGINIFSSVFKVSLTLIAYKNDTFDMVKTGLFNKFDQQIILNKGYPYSNCIDSIL